MKYCSSNGAAAYSRPALALAGTTRKAAWENGRGDFMRRWVSHHRFTLVLSAGLFLAMASRSSAGPAPSAHPEPPAAQAAPQPGGSSASPPAESKAAEQKRTEQYTLSHERQAKAVAYSRAGYTLYFVSYFLGGLFLFLILGL